MDEPLQPASAGTEVSSTSAHVSTDVPPETERTLSTSRLCEGCGRDIAGRRPQARHCSAQCRSEHRRRAQNARLAQLLATLERTVAALKRETRVAE